MTGELLVTAATPAAETNETAPEPTLFTPPPATVPCQACSPGTAHRHPHVDASTHSLYYEYRCRHSDCRAVGRVIVAAANGAVKHRDGPVFGRSLEHYRHGDTRRTDTLSADLLLAPCPGCEANWDGLFTIRGHTTAYECTKCGVAFEDNSAAPVDGETA